MATRFVPYKAANPNYAYSVKVALLEEESISVPDDEDTDTTPGLPGAGWYAFGNAFKVPLYKDTKYKTEIKVKEVPIVLMVEPDDQVTVTIIGYPEKASSKYDYKIGVVKVSGRTKVKDTFDCLITKADFERLLPDIPTY